LSCLPVAWGSILSVPFLSRDEPSPSSSGVTTYVCAYVHTYIHTSVCSTQGPVAFGPEASARARLFIPQLCLRLPFSPSRFELNSHTLSVVVSGCTLDTGVGNNSGVEQDGQIIGPHGYLRASRRGPPTSKDVRNTTHGVASMKLCSPRVTIIHDCSTPLLAPHSMMAST